MKVRDKIIAYLGLMIFAVSCILVTFIVMTAKQIRHKGSEILAELSSDVEKDVKQELLNLAKNIGNYTLALESEIDRNMLSAARALYEADRLSGGRLTIADLQRLKQQTGMSDFYLGNMDGIFTISTEQGAAGISLFDISDSYRMLVTGESNYLPSDLKIKVETGEIFKFTAIPRADYRGILESAMNANSIEKHLQNFIDTNKSIRSINLFDFTLLTLTENKAQGAQSVYKKGSYVPAGRTEAGELFTNPDNMRIVMDKKNAQVYYPVIDGGKVRYVLFMDIDTSGYFSGEIVIESEISNMLSEISILNILSLAGVLAVLLLFAFFIFIMTKNLLAPLGFFETMLDSFSKGNLTIKMPKEFLSRKDEMGNISLSFRKAVENIKKLILDVKNKAELLSNIGNDLCSNMALTVDEINHIIANMQNMRKSILTQEAGITETHAAMEQFTLNVQKLSEHIESQSSGISQAAFAVEQMAANTSSVTGTLAENESNVRTLKESSEIGRAGLQEVAADIQEIARESEGLLQINSVMQNIASRTNLLSMNAAIEAAHAGESGKGFAVVADEIRQLAENSGKQSKTIGAVLKKIKESIDKITISTGNVMNKFEAIDTSIKTVIDQEENIRNAIEEQGTDSRQAFDGVNNINRITDKVKSSSNEILNKTIEAIKKSENLEKSSQEVVMNINEAVDSAKEIDTAVQHVSDLSQKNREYIGALVNEISRFQMD